MKKITAAALVAAALAAPAVALAPVAAADYNPGCEQIRWGFLGSQRRVICDGPIQADGSWLRARVISTPAHQVPVQCFSSGSQYSSFTNCTGGYFQPEVINSAEKYPVTPDTVLPDEPGHLPPNAQNIV